jgi:hypothetical protein
MDGKSVLGKLMHHLSGPSPFPTVTGLTVFLGGRVVVLGVLLVNAHTWGLNSSYAVFLAYYLRSGTIDGASALGFAFVGGLSISICKPLPADIPPRTSLLTVACEAMLVSPFATWCIGRFGTAATLRVGVVLEA